MSGIGLANKYDAWSQQNRVKWFLRCALWKNPEVSLLSKLKIKNRSQTRKNNENFGRCMVGDKSIVFLE